MSSNILIALEMLITLGVCVGFGVHQLLDLRRANAEAAREAAEAGRNEARANAAAGER